jgi:polyisoprenyl-teichoic acid--peptidoglycan teichoic acid transferase
MWAIFRYNYEAMLDFNDVRLRRHRPRRRYGWFFVISIFLLTGLLIWGISKLATKTNQIFTSDKNIFERVGTLIVGSDKKLEGEQNGELNVLLLGYGGPNHDGPYLTDTIIVANFNIESKEVVLTSIPRDFVVELPGLGFRKINSAYAFFRDEDEPNNAGTAARVAAEKITGLTIPYYAAIDFDGFIKAINGVGGVGVTIDQTFTDSQYPNNQHGYLEPVTFTKGQEHMDGERALIFARSRKGTNGEGSDFARSKRQKKIVTAFKDRIFQLNITDLRTINNLLSVFTDNFRTNFEPHELKRLTDIGRDVSNENIFSLSLESDGILICNGLVGDYDNRAFVVQPCEGNTLADVHKFISNASLVSKLTHEGALIEIQNSTKQAYVLGPYRIINTLGPNVDIQTFRESGIYNRTILYDNSKGLKPETKKYLEANYDFSVADVPYSKSIADFVIIIGQDAL